MTSQPPDLLTPDLAEIRWKPSASILLVDDVPENRYIVRAFLSKTPVEIIEASNGEEALQEYEKKSFDLILLDMQMPILNGYETASEIRRREKTTGKTVPIVAFSASGMSQEVKKSLEAGCTSHLIKPFTKPDLFKAIVEYLSVK